MKVFKSEKGRNEVLESYDRLLNAWEVDFEETDVASEYGTTHVIQAGDKRNPALLLFHGVGDNSALMWIFNAAELAKRFRITAVDAIGGAGKSIPGPGYGRGFDQTIWLTGLMDGLGIETADAAGVSYGCYLAQLAAITMPGRMRRIVGISGSVSVEGARPNGIRMMKAFLPEALFPTERNTRKLLIKLTGPGGTGFLENPELMGHWRLLLKNFNNMSMGFHKIRKFPKAAFAQIRENALFLIGDSDILTYYPESLEIFDKLEMNHMIIEGAGHAANHEKPGEVNQMIIRFLEK